MVTWEDLTEKQQAAIAIAYNRPDRKVTSENIAGATGRALVRMGLMVSNQPASGSYYMPYMLTAHGCDVYERGNPPTLPDSALAQPATAEDGKLADQPHSSTDAVIITKEAYAALKNEIAALQAETRELAAALAANNRLTVEVSDWRIEAENRGILLEAFYKDTHELWGRWNRGKGALKRMSALSELGDVIRKYRGWQPKQPK